MPSSSSATPRLRPARPRPPGSTPGPACAASGRPKPSARGCARSLPPRRRAWRDAGMPAVRPRPSSTIARPIRPHRDLPADDALVSALARLDPEDRALLALRHVAGLSMAEVSQAVRRSRPPVEVRLARLSGGHRRARATRLRPGRARSPARAAPPRLRPRPRSPRRRGCDGAQGSRGGVARAHPGGLGRHRGRRRRVRGGAPVPRAAVLRAIASNAGPDEIAMNV